MPYVMFKLEAVHFAHIVRYSTCIYKCLTNFQKPNKIITHNITLL